jgi:hypothetical protein
VSGTPRTRTLKNNVSKSGMSGVRDHIPHHCLPAVAVKSATCARGVTCAAARKANSH